MAKKRALVTTGSEASASSSKYSPVMIVGPWVFCSGVIGRREDDGVTPTDPEEQFRVAFDILTARLEAAGAFWSDVVDMISFHTRFEQSEIRQTFRDVRAEYVQEPYPAWTSIGVERLSSPETLVEIRVVAYTGD